MGFPGVWGCLSGWASGVGGASGGILQFLGVSGGTFWVLALVLCWLVVLNLCVPGLVEG